MNCIFCFVISCATYWTTYSNELDANHVAALAPEFFSLINSGIESFLAIHTNHKMLCQPLYLRKICSPPDRQHPTCWSSIFNIFRWKMLTFKIIYPVCNYVQFTHAVLSSHNLGILDGLYDSGRKYFGGMHVGLNIGIPLPSAKRIPLLSAT